MINEVIDFVLAICTYVFKKLYVCAVAIVFICFWKLLSLFLASSPSQCKKHLNVQYELMFDSVLSSIRLCLSSGQWATRAQVSIGATCLK